MSFSIVRSSKRENFINKNEAISVRNLLESSENAVSIAEVVLDGVNKRSRNLVSDSYYYVLEGEGSFTIEKEVIPLHAGDLIFISKDTSYFDQGNMKLLAINIPAFSPENVQFIE